jgi:hypothetical protein
MVETDLLSAIEGRLIASRVGEISLRHYKDCADARANDPRPTADPMCWALQLDALNTKIKMQYPLTRPRCPARGARLLP